MEDIRRSYDVAKDVEMGTVPTPETAQAIRDLGAAVMAGSR